MQTPNTQALRSTVSNVPYRVAVLTSGAIAIGALALNYTDNRSTVGYTQVCFKPSEQVRNRKGNYCTASQRHWIADPILKQWEQKQPEFYHKLTRLKTLPPENNNKHYYGLVAMGGALVMGGLAAARLNLINRLAPGYRQETHTQWHREAVKNNVQRASDAINGQYMVQSLQYQREVDLGRMQAGYLTPQEIEAQLVQQNYEQEYLQGQQQASLAQPEQQQLPGQSINDVTNPGDKINAATSASTYIKPGLISTLESSAIAPALKAGVLKVIGGQGAGKTTLVNGGLLRYRLHLGHKLIIVNPHKSYEMYDGLEPYLEPNTKFYGIGKSDKDRAESLLAGIKKILGVLDKRYTEYQNQPKSSYNHYPITILLEECGEWSGLLGEKAIPLIQAFWQKMFVACRKGMLFPIITAQHDTIAMFGNPKGLADLIKSSGVVTLNLIAIPDVNSPDGWKPSGKGKLFIPNQEAKDINVPDVRKLVGNPDVFTNLSTATTNSEADRLNAARSLIQDCWEADSPKPENTQVQLSETAQKVLSIIQSSTKPTISLEAIRKSRRWGNSTISLEQLKKALQELIKAEKISGDEDNGYSALS